MKVIVTLEVEVDPEEWDMTYGTGTKAADVRKDVKEYVAHSIHDLMQENNGGAATLRK